MANKDFKAVRINENLASTPLTLIFKPIDVRMIRKISLTEM